MVFDYVAQFVAEITDKRVWLEHVEVSEHSGNSAIYSEEDAGPLCVGDSAHTEIRFKVESP